MDPIVVVSGVPRSGTSMMMQALAAGGISVLTDGTRVADADNVNGYFELESVKRMGRGESAFLVEAGARAIKVIHTLLPQLPLAFKYRVVFMMRDLDEVIRSQKRMLERKAKATVPLSESALKAVLEKQRESALAWARDQPDIELILVGHGEAIARPVETISLVNDFLGGALDVDAMAAVVDPSLRHHDAGRAAIVGGAERAS